MSHVCSMRVVKPEVLSPLNFATHEMEDPFAMPQCFWAPGSECPKESSEECRFFALLGLLDANKTLFGALFAALSEPGASEQNLRRLF